MKAGGGTARRLVLSVRPTPGDGKKALVRFGPLTFRAALGRGGISIFKREGDGATPHGWLEIVSGFRRVGLRRRVVAGLPMRPVGAADGWCDAPGHPSYNRPVRLPFSASHEKLRREDALYDIVLVLDWNFRRRARGLGSAIFAHVARPGYLPTEGCIAFHPRDLARILPLVGRGSAFVVSRS
jgi:Uncharacterized protein conserved in bacteria